MIKARFAPVLSAPCLLLGLTLSVGCDYLGLTESRIDIEVARDARGYLFSFKSCRHLFATETIEVPLIVVLKGADEGDASPVQCDVQKGSPSAHGIVGSWRYGETPVGYKEAQCDPLKPGEYQIQVGGAL